MTRARELSGAGTGIGTGDGGYYYGRMGAHTVIDRSSTLEKSAGSSKTEKKVQTQRTALRRAHGNWDEAVRPAPKANDTLVTKKRRTHEQMGSIDSLSG